MARRPTPHSTMRSLRMPARTGPDGARWSLSPVGLARLRAGTRLVLPSPNGSELAYGARKHAPQRRRRGGLPAQRLGRGARDGGVAARRPGRGHRRRRTLGGGRRPGRRSPWRVRSPPGRRGPVGRRRHPAGAAGADGRGSRSCLTRGAGGHGRLRRGARRPAGVAARLHVRSGARRPGPAATTWWRPRHWTSRRSRRSSSALPSSVPRRDRSAIYAEPMSSEVGE